MLLYETDNQTKVSIWHSLPGDSDWNVTILLSSQIQVANKIPVPFWLRQLQSFWFFDLSIFQSVDRLIAEHLFHLTFGMTPDGSLNVSAVVV